MLKRNLLVVGLVLLLGGCGFQLRGTGDYGFDLDAMDVQARDAYGDTVKELRDMLEQSDVRVAPGAPYTLYIEREQQSQRAASYTSGSRTAETELTQRLDYQIRGTQGMPPLLTDHVEVQRVFAYDGNNPNGNGLEAQQLRSEMRRDLLQQMLLRLQSVKKADLERRQEELRLQAEAARAAQRRAQESAPPQQSPIEFPLPAR